MLDIATGNGPIPQLACTHCAGRAAGMPRIDAIDLAQVAPAWVSSQPTPCRQALHFHSGVSAEALPFRSEEHTSELQSLMRTSYAVLCLQKQKTRAYKTENS